MVVELILAVVVSGGLAAYSFSQYQHSERLLEEAHSDNARALGDTLKQRMELEAQGDSATLSE